MDGQVSALEPPKRAKLSDLGVATRWPGVKALTLTDAKAVGAFLGASGASMHLPKLETVKVHLVGACTHACCEHARMHGTMGDSGETWHNKAPCPSSREDGTGQRLVAPSFCEP